MYDNVAVIPRQSVCVDESVSVAMPKNNLFAEVGLTFSRDPFKRLRLQMYGKISDALEPEFVQSPPDKHQLVMKSLLHTRLACL